jgi:alpha-glucosidase
MRQVMEEFDDRVLIGEIYLPVERLVAYYGKHLLGAQMPFNFALLSAAWNARAIEKIVAEYEHALPRGAWPNWVLGNHDPPRVASGVGRDQARVAAMLLLTLRGSPTLYYGDEIGMHQVAIAADQVQDPFEKNVPGIGVGRDGCRTPMAAASGRLPARERPQLQHRMDVCGSQIGMRNASPPTFQKAHPLISLTRLVHEQSLSQPLDTWQ